jgi:F0F1-type ATP synthase assembly protein I
VPKENDRASLLRGMGPLMNLGVTFALSIGGLAYLGHWLDGKLDTKPWMTLLGAVLGMVVGFVNLFRVVLPPRKGSS